MSSGKENDPFQRIIDTSWQDTGAHYVPTEESYNDDWPEDRSSHVLSRRLCENGLMRYRNRRGTHTCTPPSGYLKKIMQEINEDKIFYDDTTTVVLAPRAGVRTSGGKVEIDDNPKTPDDFYDFADYRTEHAD